MSTSDDTVTGFAVDSAAAPRCAFETSRAGIRESPRGSTLYLGLLVLTAVATAAAASADLRRGAKLSAAGRLLGSRLRALV